METVLPYLVVGLGASTAAIIDVRESRVPNRLTFTLLVCGVLYHGMFGGLEGLKLSLLGAAFGLLSLFFAYLFGLLGAGDVKLMAAVGAWLGMPLVSQVLVCTLAVLCIYSAVVLLSKYGFKMLVANWNLFLFRLQTIGKHFVPDERVEDIAKDPARRSSVIPFALVIALGYGCALLWQLFARA